MHLHEASLVSELSLLSRALDIRLVAEAWDIARYQLGRDFPGLDWLQWNGKFRDDVRAFVRGEARQGRRVDAAALRQRRSLSRRIHETCRPHQSINFVTAHDGFCLYDLVSYDRKHNEANGHDNTDGADDNLSWNCGGEGDAGASAAVLALRRQQVKNFCALLMLANGIPMFVAGDEFLNTQRGNNNPYNQDNEITWLDWARLDANRDIFRFFKLMIAFRKAHGIGRLTFWREDVSWHGPDGPVDLSTRVALPGLCAARRRGRRWRPLRDDQRALGRSHFTLPGGEACRVAARRRHGPPLPRRHRRTRPRSGAGQPALHGARAFRGRLPERQH